MEFGVEWGQRMVSDESEMGRGQKVGKAWEAGGSEVAVRQGRLGASDPGQGSVLIRRCGDQRGEKGY